MSVDSLLKYAEKSNIIIAHGISDSNMGIINPDFNIIIGDCHIENQVRTLLHELFHLHPRFMPYTKKFWEGGTERDEIIESYIEAAAISVYNTRQDIVDFLKEKLRKAGKYKRNLDMKKSVRGWWSNSA